MLSAPAPFTTNHRRKYNVRLSKRTIGLSVLALATTGWFLGRGMGSELRAEPTTTKTDPHVIVSAPSLVQATQIARQPRQPDTATPVHHPLQPQTQEQYHERNPHEWQGMLVDMSMRQVCDQTTSCGLALSCSDDGQCGPCAVDDDCAGGEACVLDHCLPASQVACTSRDDCAHIAGMGDDAYCVLSGLTGGEHRGNSQMRAHCQASAGGPEPQVASADTPRRQRHGDHVRPAFNRQDLVKELADKLR